MVEEFTGSTVIKLTSTYPRPLSASSNHTPPSQLFQIRQPSCPLSVTYTMELAGSTATVGWLRSGNTLAPMGVKLTPPSVLFRMPPAARKVYVAYSVDGAPGSITNEVIESFW